MVSVASTTKADAAAEFVAGSAGHQSTMAVAVVISASAAEDPGDTEVVSDMLGGPGNAKVVSWLDFEAETPQESFWIFYRVSARVSMNTSVLFPRSDLLIRCGCSPCL